MYPNDTHRFPKPFFICIILSNDIKFRDPFKGFTSIRKGIQLTKIREEWATAFVSKKGILIKFKIYSGNSLYS